MQPWTATVFDPQRGTLVTVQAAESTAPAEWLLDHDDWQHLVRFGPRGFDCYVRVEFGAQDARRTSQPEPEDEEPAMRQVLDLLSEYTSTPERAYAAIWEGWTGGPTPPAPRLRIPHRPMLVFTGPVSAMRDAPASAWQHPGRVLQEPHLVWPEDRLWLVACEVDEEIEFTVGCDSATAALLLGAFGAGARVVEYGEGVPLYR